MFWGISLESGKRYSQTVEKSFHISMAALNAKNSGKGSVTIMVEVEKASYPLCTLNPDKIPQQALDHVFTEGEEVLFYTAGGDVEVHLTGYLIDDPNPVEYSSDEEESASNASSSGVENDEENENINAEEESNEEENLNNLLTELDSLHEDNEETVDMWLPRSARKKHKKNDDSEQLQASLTEKLLDDDSDEEDDADWQPGSKRKISSKKTTSAEDTKKLKQTNTGPIELKKHGEVSDNSSRDDIANTPPKSKKKTQHKDKLQSPSNGLNDSAGNDSSDKKDMQVENISNEDSKSKQVHKNHEDVHHHERKHLPGGTTIEDIVVGKGKKAKKGRQVSLYYRGTLKKSKKMFDEKMGGEPFTFRLGDGEVIRGWETGIEGMHVGGKRKLVIPPSQGYGSKQMSSSIPPNSTLVFIVELIKVH